MILTKEETTRSERYRSYCNGWVDGAKATIRDRRFTEHSTRPDLTEEYCTGYRDGARDRNEALKAASTRLDYAPSVLREEAQR